MTGCFMRTAICLNPLVFPVPADRRRGVLARQIFNLWIFFFQLFSPDAAFELMCLETNSISPPEAAGTVQLPGDQPIRSTVLKFCEPLRELEVS